MRIAIVPVVTPMCGFRAVCISYPCLNLPSGIAVLVDLTLGIGGALLVSADSLFTNRRAQIIALAARYNFAAVYPFRAFVEGDGLIVHAAELTWAYRYIGVYAGRILKGTDARDLSVVLPSNFQLVINVRTAKALGLTIPVGRGSGPVSETLYKFGPQL